MVQERLMTPTSASMTPLDQPGPEPGRLSARYRQVRSRTEALCEPLQPEDFVLQAMPDASPTKWHLAHTSWFFETFCLAALSERYRPIREDANFLFNSYYNAVGERIARDRRGMLSRPSIGEIFGYRREVDRRMAVALSEASEEALRTISPIVEIGLNHEQQHQELILTDLKAAFGRNPTRPVYRDVPKTERAADSLRWIDHRGGLASIGHDGSGFAFDNEAPRHKVFLEPFSLASRPCTNGEYLAFMDGGGYQRPEFWLSDGWATKTAENWSSPLYWERCGGSWSTFTLSGVLPIDESEPVAHVSFYEADAFARWSGARLPTEAEWETVAAHEPVEGNLLEDEAFHPRAAGTRTGPGQLYGDVWEWTASPYVAYPGYRTAEGALGEYNGKFMCNQFVLRGGSCATPASHIRASYRNFFPPHARWQFMGLRLAK
jgi:ergothioneine biosynthesis protein EgtB